LRWRQIGRRDGVQGENTDGSGYAILHNFTGGSNDGATPDGGFLMYNGVVFTGWSDDGNSDNPCTYVMPSSDVNLPANFAPAATITVQPGSPGAGTISGGGTFAIGSQQTLTANPTMGWKFINWNDGNTNNPRILLLTTNVTLSANFTNAPMYLLIQAGDGGMAGRWMLGTNYTPVTWAQVTGTMGNGWVLRTLNQNRILLQQGNGGLIGIWGLNTNGLPATWSTVSGPMPGWIARDLDGNRILLQAGDGGIIGIWSLSTNNTPAKWNYLSGPIAGLIARGLCGNRVLLQFAGGNPSGYWTLDASNNVTAWTPINASLPVGWILRSMTPNYMLLQAGDGGMTGMWDLDANGQPTAWHTIYGALPGWIMRGIDQ